MDEKADNQGEAIAPPVPTVFLVDDDDRIRASLTRALQKRGFQVRAFASAEAFLEFYDPSLPGCLVLDYGMPGLNGLELQKHLSDQKVMIPIIFISGHGGVPESVQAIKGGAIDFLEKPFRQHTLVACIEDAFANDQRIRAEAQASETARSRYLRLTAREREVAQFMIANPGTTSSKEVGRELDISPRTVDHHRARILEKLNIKSVVELIDLSLSAALPDAEDE